MCACMLPTLSCSASRVVATVPTMMGLPLPFFLEYQTSIRSGVVGPSFARSCSGSHPGSRSSGESAGVVAGSLRWTTHTYSVTVTGGHLGSTECLLTALSTRSDLTPLCVPCSSVWFASSTVRWQCRARGVCRAPAGQLLLRTRIRDWRYKRKKVEGLPNTLGLSISCAASCSVTRAVPSSFWSCPPGHRMQR